MNTLTNEQLFVLVVESGGFKPAAEFSGIDPSSVSRRIAALEQRLGTKLVERSTRRSEPTEAGSLYYQGLKSLLDEQQALESHISEAAARPQGTLKVAAPHDFGIQFVVPVLEQMVSKSPDLNVELVFGSHFEDLKARQIDVAVRIGQLADSSLICRRIGEVPRVLVAAKSYIDLRGMPTAVDDLKQLEYIHYSKASADNPIRLDTTEGVFSVDMPSRFIANSVTAIKQLVLSGQGVHLGPEWAFKEALDSGELVQLLPNLKLQSYPLHALYLSRSYVPAKIRLFIELLSEKYRDHGFDGANS